MNKNKKAQIIKGLNKLSFIVKVMNSCVTTQQLNSCFNWGYVVTRNHRKESKKIMSENDSLNEYYYSIEMLKDKYKKALENIIEYEKTMHS